MYLKKIFVIFFTIAFALNLLTCNSFFRKSPDSAEKTVHTCPIEAYYAGCIEEAMRMLSGSRAKPEQRRQLVTLLWEIGDNASAANLLEGLTKDTRLSADERNDLLPELFITYVLMGDYSRAAALRKTVEPIIQESDNRKIAEYYFYDAWVYHEMGDPEKAAALYRRSVEMYKWRALAWYRLGTILQDKDPKEAEKAFLAAWNDDRSFNPALLPLIRLLAARGDWKQAREYLSVAAARFPDDPEIKSLLEEALRRAPVPVSSDGMNLIRRQITAVPPKVKPAAVIQGEGIMRIGLNVSRELVSVKAGGAFTLQNLQTGQVIYTGIEKEQFWVAQKDDAGIVITGLNNKVLFNGSNSVKYELRSDQDTSIIAGIVSGAPGTNRTYRGSLEFIPKTAGITVVNIVNMGDYLYGVVPSELPATWPQAALRAQAIAARSYAMAYRGTYAGIGFDIWCTARSQAYNGVGSEHANTTAAVDATSGVILVGENDNVLAAYYSANHGGHSEASLAMWGRDAYMQAVSDVMLPPRTSPLTPDALFRWIGSSPETYSNVQGFFYSNTYRWERWIQPEEIRRRMISDSRIAQDPGEIRRIVTRGRGISGRIIELEVQGSERNVIVKGDLIWFNMGGLRSSLFTIRSMQNADGGIQYFCFQGAGYGHGIGLDQHAAGGKASKGFSAEEILLHFYPRASLRQL